MPLDMGATVWIVLPIAMDQTANDVVMTITCAKTVTVHPASVIESVQVPLNVAEAENVNVEQG